MIHMGVTAENVATSGNHARRADKLAVESHRRAAAATKEGRFKSQIVPVEIKGKKGAAMFDTDEHFRDGATLEDMAKLKPVFAKENGTVTAGNASGINDGAAAVVLMERSVAEKRGLKPMARLVSYGHAGVDPKFMGIGPVPSTRKALERAGLKVSDLDVIEANEALQRKPVQWRRILVFRRKAKSKRQRILAWASIGATGAMITVKALYELERTGGRYALATMCIGGGQGIAAVFERM